MLPTDKQMKYLRKLVADSGQEIHQFLIDNGISELKGFREPTQVATMPSKAEASRLIDQLKSGKSQGHAPDLDIMLDY